MNAPSENLLWIDELLRNGRIRETNPQALSARREADQGSTTERKSTINIDQSIIPGCLGVAPPPPPPSLERSLCERVVFESSRPTGPPLHDLLCEELYHQHPHHSSHCTQRLITRGEIAKS